MLILIIFSSPLLFVELLIDSFHQLIFFHSHSYTHIQVNSLTYVNGMCVEIVFPWIIFNIISLLWWTNFMEWNQCDNIEVSFMFVCVRDLMIIWLSSLIKFYTLWSKFVKYFPPHNHQHLYSQLIYLKIIISLLFALCHYCWSIIIVWNEKNCNLFLVNFEMFLATAKRKKIWLNFFLIRISTRNVKDTSK